MKITTVGIDLAKNVFQIHAIDGHGKVALKKQLKRDKVAEFFVNLPPCLVGMEACGSAHHWARIGRRSAPHHGHRTDRSHSESIKTCRNETKRYSISRTQ